jgi:hypothetical protein
LVGVIVAAEVAVGFVVLLGDGVTLWFRVGLGATTVALGKLVAVTFTTGFPLGSHPPAMNIKLNPREIPASVLIVFLFIPINSLMLSDMS